MKISIVSRNCDLPEAIRELAHRRFLFALSRYSSKIHRVSLVVSDANGPRGGIDEVCDVSVRMRRAPEVRISCEDSELGACFSRSAHRAARAVSRVIDRSRDVDRRRPVLAQPRV